MEDNKSPKVKSKSKMTKVNMNLDFYGRYNSSIVKVTSQNLLVLLFD